MDIYIYASATYCPDCAKKIMDDLKAKGQAPANPDDETTFDSDVYPKGPYPDGGGEADAFQHCADCRCFLGNSLTADGVKYSIQALAGYVENEEVSPNVLDTWTDELKNYGLDQYQGFVLVAYLKVRELENQGRDTSMAAYLKVRELENQVHELENQIRDKN